ncbi:MAG TPA: cyclase family protein [Pirellulales bacterium]|nr:cyclase family protein [Pirellulales bacterium]
MPHVVRTFTDRPPVKQPASPRPIESPRRAARAAGLAWLASVAMSCIAAVGVAGEPRIVDLSLTISPEMPCNWPAGWPPFALVPQRRIGPLSGYQVDTLFIDGNCGTQMDVPPHSVPHPDTNLPAANPYGRVYTDKAPAWQFGGEACVIDCRDAVSAAPDGHSALIKKDRVVAWERAHRPLGPGDVVVFRSGYTDQFYQPLPAGRRFLADPLDGRAPAWPDPDPECMEYLAGRKVLTLATDSASMGPIPDLAEPTHYAGLKYGMVWTESATGLGELPETGAFYCMLGLKHADGLYAECRALAVVGEPLAKQLIESARHRRVADLSVTLSPDYPLTWPGAGSGNHRQSYLKIPLYYAPNLATYHVTHLFDSQAGTHLVPPAYALPPADFDNDDYAPEVRRWLAEFEKDYGPRGTSDVTAEQVPLDQTCGWARVVDVRHLVGTTEKASWPRSPEITVADIERYEHEQGELEPGEILLFRSDYTDTWFKSLPEGQAFLADPLNGKREGWPALSAAAAIYLARSGIRCVGTDAPALGGADPEQAQMTYWALGSRGMVGVEFLNGLGKLPEGPYFMFAPLKIRGCHGGPGRAIALY